MKAKSGVARRLAARVRDREWRAVVKLQPSKVRVVARLLPSAPRPRLVPRRLYRAAASHHPLRMASVDVAAARLSRRRRVRQSVEAPGDTAAGWVPVGAVLALAGRARGRVRVRVRLVESGGWTRTTVRARLPGRRGPGDPPPLLDPPGAHNPLVVKAVPHRTVLPRGRTGHTTWEFLTSHSLMDEWIAAVLGEIAHATGVPAETFGPAPTDPATYASVQPREVHKARLTFLETGNRRTPKPGSLLDEWAVLRRLQHHPGVCAAISYEEREDWERLTTERLDGAPLDEWLQDGRGDAARLDRVVLSLADLERYMRQRGINHRDLRPANIRVDDRGVCRLFDFDHAVVSHSADLDGHVPAVGGVERFVPEWDFDGVKASYGLAEAERDLLGDVLAHTGAGPSRSRESPSAEEGLAKAEAFWREWHAVCELSRGLLAGRRVLVCGPGAGPCALLVALWGARSVHLPSPAAQQDGLFRLRERLGLADAVHVSPAGHAAEVDADVVVHLDDADQTGTPRESLPPTAGDLITWVGAEAPSAWFSAMERQGWRLRRVLSAPGPPMAWFGRQGDAHAGANRV